MKTKSFGSKTRKVAMYDTNKNLDQVDCIHVRCQCNFEINLLSPDSNIEQMKHINYDY